MMARRRKEDEFIIYMFKQDVENMKEWVLQYPNKETGGDLFGLWSKQDDAVIQVVLGPGRECIHGDDYFYQDTSYLKKVVNLLKQDYMLGHIGEWHSHHQLKLDEPSKGDCGTLERNFPKGTHGFFMLIANIDTKGQVKISPYIFKAGSKDYKGGRIEVIGDLSPFEFVPKILETIKNGKEETNQKNTKKQDDEFVIYMFKQDFENMKKWVLQYPNKETGGDLFGLWSEQDDAVIHVVLGPGRECIHGDYHFYQDVSYLEKVGNLLTQDYMLGHIGEWHSHHQLKLDEPSEGDCRTLERHFPKGAQGFFLLIANIDKKGQVKISPYIFKGSRDYRGGRIEVIGDLSPFKLVPEILEAVNKGKEETNKKKKSENSSFLNTVTQSIISYVTSFLQSVKPDYTNYLQWYRQEGGRAVLEDILLMLKNIAKDVVILMDNDRYQNISMEFLYKESQIKIEFPTDFPRYSAYVQIYGRPKIMINLSRTFQSFDPQEFVTEMHNILKPYFTDPICTAKLYKYSK